MHHLKILITKQNGKQSVGKGFSPNELKEAGVNKQQAKQLGFRVDVKRKSTHKENVDCIKTHAQEARTKAAALPKKPKPKFKAKAKS
jgi:large subunit ribosomal protein L13e